MKTESTYPVVEHPDDGGTLVVRDVVEDLVHLGRVTDLHLDWVRVLKRVQLQSRDQRARDELRPARSGF